jgi:hypothetical protein
VELLDLKPKAFADSYIHTGTICVSIRFSLAIAFISVLVHQVVLIILYESLEIAMTNMTEYLSMMTVIYDLGE